MKILDNILNNYYSKKLTEKIINITWCYCLDRKTEIKNDKINILVKPKHYKYYTLLYSFRKENSFTEILNFEKIRKYIKENIEDKDENNTWNKKEK